MIRLLFIQIIFLGTEKGKKTEYTFDYSAAIRLKEGINNISILGCTVGLPVKILKIFLHFRQLL